MTYRAELMSYHSDCGWPDPSKGGFKTEEDAFEYVKSMCPIHKLGDKIKIYDTESTLDFPASTEEDIELGYCSYCEAEWMTFDETMKLTPIAQRLQDYRTNTAKYDEQSYPDKEVESLATCMGSENFSYALYEGGYLNPKEWLEGEDLIEVERAIEKVRQFKDLVESLHEEF